MHEAPKRFKLRKGYSSLGSLIELSDQILAVDGPLKDIIERFEPGVHYFFPIEIVMPRKVIYLKQYFVMAIGQWLDSFSPEQSDPASWRKSEGDYGGRVCFFFEERKALMSGLALSRPIFDEAHLWRERRMLNPLMAYPIN